VTGLNAAGEVIGYGNEAANASTHAFAYSGGQIKDLGTLGGSTSSAVAVNNAGAVIGNSNTSGDAASHAFLYKVGTMTDLGTLGGKSSFATAINAAGVVVGTSTLQGDTARHAFEYTSSGMVDLGTLPGFNSSTAVAVNSAGQVIGNATTAGSAATHAFLFANGKLTDLGTLGGTNSYAIGMDSFGDVIGLSDVVLADGSTAQHSFLYGISTNNKMTDLSTIVPGVNFVAAGINDALQIIGTATTTTTNLVRGLIVSAVPEADGAALALAGFAMLGWVARTRRRG